MNKRPGLCLAAGCALVLAGRAASAGTATVSYLDGFLVRTEKVEIVSRDLREIVFVRPGADGKERVTVEWKDLRSIDGEPAEAVLAKIRSEYEDRLCPDCRGGAERKPCARCGGTGKLVEKTMPCRRCKATGTTACAARGCEGGQVPCPGPCIKWGVGRWEEWPGYGMCRIWEWTDRAGRKQKQGASKAHIGEVCEIRDGNFVKLGKCKECGGKSTVPCQACKGAGTTECPVCKGKKEEPDPEFTRACPDCREGFIVCERCGGTGLLGEGAGAPAAAGAPAGPARERDPNAIHLKDGREIRGRIVIRSKDMVIVRTDSGETLRIKTADIDSMP